MKPLAVHGVGSCALALLVSTLLCYVQDVSPSDCSTTAIDSWVKNGSHEYRIFPYNVTRNVSWEAAEQHCVSLNSHLVRIKSDQEYRFLYKCLVQPYKSQLGFEDNVTFGGFVGFVTNNSTGKLQWTDGSKVDLISENITESNSSTGQCGLIHDFTNGSTFEPTGFTLVDCDSSQNHSLAPAFICKKKVKIPCPPLQAAHASVYCSLQDDGGTPLISSNAIPSGAKCVVKCHRKYHIKLEIIKQELICHDNGLWRPLPAPCVFRNFNRDRKSGAEGRNVTEIWRGGTASIAAVSVLTIVILVAGGGMAYILCCKRKGPEGLTLDDADAEFMDAVAEQEAVPAIVETFE